jgi:ABC-type transporter Mla subunit MlaD
MSMTNKREMKRFVAQVEKLKKRIAADRNELRDLIATAEELADCCERAHDDLERAADALSEYV